MDDTLESSRLIVVVGPTASGKSDLAQEIARELNGCVLSADSMQIYRGMDIGTGKLLSHEQYVPHYGLDLADPGESYSVAVFQEYGRKLIDEQLAMGKAVVVCGGTGFYIRALIDEFDFPAGNQDDNPVREKYSRLLEEIGPHALWEELKRVDPASAEVVHENDTKRVIRAFELLADGTSYNKQKEAFQKIPQHYPATFIGLKVEPAILNARIDRRVDKMVAAGLVEEVRGLLSQGLREGLTAQYAIGYKEIVAYLDGECSLEEAIASIKISTHRYAKRQRTWFRKDLRIHWISADEYDLSRLTRQSLDIIEKVSH
ncbi:MAG: tRNA (adenosine(37)-N6)-dimethylallyltransferase MiaA [Coriobacteriaceae bacterium]|nr:tRNA (adenosine(37)-N6)-dimethylallyltransferase MiaA [Coriobacteriaceae bacterium]